MGNDHFFLLNSKICSLGFIYFQKGYEHKKKKNCEKKEKKIEFPCLKYI